MKRTKTLNKGWDKALNVASQRLLRVLTTQAWAAYAASERGGDPTPHLNAVYTALRALGKIAELENVTPTQIIQVITNAPPLGEPDFPTGT